MPYIPPYLSGNPMMPYQSSQYAQYDPSLVYQQMQQQYQQNPGYAQVNNQQTQQISQNQIQQNLSGRFVNSPNDIAVNEVDMRGSVSIFPVNDMSAIYAKQWTADGKIQTVKYIPSVEEPSANANQSDAQVIDYAPVMERLDRIEQLLSAKSTSSRSKKGDTENEN